MPGKRGQNSAVSKVAERPSPPKPIATNQTTALVAEVVEPAPPEWERGLEPRSMDDARQLAKWMHESRMFSAYGTPQAVLSTMLLGRELGMPAMAALRSVHVIEGKHSLSADLMVALVLKSGMAEYFQLERVHRCAVHLRDEAEGQPTAAAPHLHHRAGEAGRALGTHALREA